MLGALVAKRAATRAFDILNRRDADGAVAGLAANGVMDYPGDSALSGVFEGKEAIHKRMADWFNQKQNVKFNLHNVAVDRVAAMGPSNTVIAEWTLSTDTVTGEPLEMDGITVLEIKRGKVVRIKDYLYEPAQATACYGPRLD